MSARAASPGDCRADIKPSRGILVVLLRQCVRRARMRAGGNRRAALQRITWGKAECLVDE